MLAMERLSVISAEPSETPGPQFPAPRRAGPGVHGGRMGRLRPRRQERLLRLNGRGFAGKGLDGGQVELPILRAGQEAFPLVPVTQAVTGKRCERDIYGVDATRLKAWMPRSCRNFMNASTMQYGPGRGWLRAVLA